MYDVAYQKKKEILLWCYALLPGNDASEKDAPRKAKDSENASDSSKCGKKIRKLRDIVSELKEKHGTKYSPELLTSWAHMVDMEKHDSYDEPPNLPFFVGCKNPTKKTTDHEKAAEVEIDSAPDSRLPTGTCLGKRIKYRSECMDQLSKWHDLLEKGVVNQQQYQEMQSKILSDIANI